MKKFRSQIVASLAVALFAVSASANFTPVPTKEEAPLRLVFGITEANSFDPLAMQNLGGNLSLVVGLGSGFDFGARIHGGVNNAYPEDLSKPGLFKPGYAFGGDVGGDIMLRFLGNVSDAFFMGIQASGGYTYMFGRTPVAQTTALTDASNITVTAGLVFGFNFADVVNLYLYPAFEGGRRDGTVPDNGKVWGSLYGASVAVGTWIDMGGTNLVLEAKPRLYNWSAAGDAKSYGMEATVGLGWDI